jgi:CHAT domain-containing protein
MFLSHRTDAYERIIDVLMRQGKSREALYYAESSRARVFRETLAAARLKSDEVNPATLIDAATIERKMALHQGVLIEYALGSDRSYVWAVTARKTVGAALPPQADIERAVRAYRQSLIARDTRLGTAAGRLYRMLVGPIASELASETTIIIAADGVLHYLPFESLVTENGHFLAEDFTFAYTPSASALDNWDRTSPKTWNKALLALGDPDFGKNGLEAEGVTGLTRRVDVNRGLRISPLPNTRVEVQNIASLYPPESSKLLLGHDASKVSLAKQTLRDFQDIHIATHAFYDEARPERSGIVLSATDQDDGVLRFGDIVKLRLNADLVVLSACQTGLGKLIRGEGIDGIARAFLFAGTPRVVVSLWNVNDVATADLMKAFYGRMTAGVPPAQALREAKVKMIRSKIVGYRDPYLWAPFVLIGRP